MLSTLLSRAAVGMIAFMVLDGLWLGVVMKSYYRQQLSPIVRLENGGIAPNWPAAIVVYVLLGLGVAIFVAPRASSLSSAAALGALLGLTVYGVYDFTNYSTLKQWPLGLTLVDTAWGTMATALAASAVWTAAR